MRREFELSEDDEGCLRARGLEWEAVREGNAKLLIIPKYPIPAGYNVSVARTGLRMPPSYPDDQIDMVFFQPALALLNGKVIQKLSMQPFDGGQYQQWSRHRTEANPWRPGIDNVGTHLVLVDSWLLREMGK